MTVVKYKRLKLVVQGVIAEFDEEGNIIGEQVTEPQPIYNREQLLEFSDKLDSDIEMRNNDVNGTRIPSEDN
jgi:hypothetical protein